MVVNDDFFSENTYECYQIQNKTYEHSIIPPKLKQRKEGKRKSKKLKLLRCTNIHLPLFSLKYLPR